MKISTAKIDRFGMVLGLLLPLLSGCGNGEKLEVFVYFPSEEALEATELLRVQVIEPATESSCAVLLSGDSSPGQEGYHIEGEVENALSASGASWDVGEVGPGRRLFFAQAEDASNAVILHGCTDKQVDGGGTVTIDLAETVPPCTQDSECDDSHPCTTDSCEAGECSNQTVAAGSPCDSGDGNPCNGTCDADGVCTSDPVECDDGEMCNGLETCNTQDGSCVAGDNRPASDYCVEDELISCDGDGGQTARDVCGFGCNPDVDPDRCLRLAPSNLTPELLCSNPYDLVISAPATIDTDLGMITGVAAEDIVFTTIDQGAGNPPIGVFSFNSVTVHSDVSVIGTNALALAVCQEVTIAAQVNACAALESGGPGGQDGGRRERDGLGYESGAGLSGASGPQVSSGGGGGAFGGMGGAGGSEPDKQVPGGAGGQSYGDLSELIPLLGGSGGGGGGGANDGGHGGGGGGAVQISAGGNLSVVSGAGINVCGAGGGPATLVGGGGGGGGAGGAILLEAAAVGIAGILSANGGGGGGGWAGIDQPVAEAGQDGQFGITPAGGGPAGGEGGYGGAGGAGASGDGVDGDTNLAAGGGGGASGRMHINTLSGSAELPGQVSPDADSGLLTQGTVNTW